jgi:hypothetical protein
MLVIGRYLGYRAAIIRRRSVYAQAERVQSAVVVVYHAVPRALVGEVAT